MTQHRAPLPASETHFGINCLGALSGFAAAILWQNMDILPRAILVMVATALPILLADLVFFRQHRHPAAGLAQMREMSYRRVATKYLGFIGILSFFALLYWLFPVYRDTFYLPYWQLLKHLVPLMLIAAPFYFAWCDKRLNTPEDGYYHAGRLLMCKRDAALRPILIQLRNWLVKAFFLPLMFVFLIQNLQGVANAKNANWFSPRDLYFILNNGIYLVDLLFASVGYIFTLRLTNAHIRSSEPTFFGWVVAIICYPPFWTMLFFNQYFDYDRDGNFIAQLNEYPAITIVTGVVILLLITIYSLATVSLGCRFSNLTYRGLVTNGPYRWCKHPAYVAKNISWWLIALPFVTYLPTGETLRNCLLLAAINLLYYLRARTEERHLSNYPEYVAYAEAMNERSLFAPLARILPFLRYRKPMNPPHID